MARRDDDDDDDDGRPRKKRRSRDEDEDDGDDDDRPRKKRRSRDDDDDDDDDDNNDDRPRKKRRSRDDDDDDDRPRKKKPKRPRRAMPGLLIAMAVVALVVGLCSLAFSIIIVVVSLQAISLLGFVPLTAHGLVQGLASFVAAAAIIAGGIVLLLRMAFGRNVVFFGTLALVVLRVIGFIVFASMLRSFSAYLAGQLAGQIVAILILGGIAAFFFNCSQNDDVNQYLR